MGVELDTGVADLDTGVVGLDIGAAELLAPVT